VLPLPAPPVPSTLRRPDVPPSTFPPELTCTPYWELPELPPLPAKVTVPRPVDCTNAPEPFTLMPTKVPEVGVACWLAERARFPSTVEIFAPAAREISRTVVSEIAPAPEAE